MGASIRRIAGAALTASVFLARAALAQPVVESPPQDSSLIRWDPALRHGVLANGLQYVVMRNQTPSGGVSIRLGIEAGSLNDKNEALGEAHFLEHMAFGGSHAQLQPDVEKTFAALGVAFGRDRNARTSLFDTVYEIDLPHGDDAELDLGFHWLRAVADGAQLRPEEVERERGVIQAERAVRQSDITQVSDRLTAFQAPGSLLARGPMIGTRESIDGISAAELQTFYTRWYQPSNAAVVVVGDEPLDQLEARVRQAFGSWRSAVAAPLSAAPSPVDEKRGLDVLILNEPYFPDTISVCRSRSASPKMPHDVADLRRGLLSQLWVEIANTRLTRLQQSNSGIIEAKASTKEIRQQLATTCFGGFPIHENWSQSLATVERQTQQLVATPPDEGELEVAVKTLRAQLRGSLFAKDTRASSELAEGVLSSLLEGRAYPSPVEAIRVFDGAVEGVTPADVQAAFRRDWFGAGPLIQIVASVPPDAAAVRQAWLAGPASVAVADSPAAPRITWAYQSFGRPGRVVKRDVFPGSDFVRLSFANGVRLNFKHTAFEKNTVAVRVRMGAGRHELGPSDYRAATLGATVFEKGGLGRNSYQDLSALFPEDGLQVDLKVGDDGFSLKSKTTPNNLQTDLQLSAAYVVDPGFRDLDGLMATIWQTGLKLVRTYPKVMLMQTLIDGVAPGSPESLLSSASAPTPTAADLAHAVKPALIQAPLEITIVGDIDEKAAVDSVGSTFGALPARKDVSRVRPDAWFLRFPDHRPALIQGFHEGAAEKAAVALVWPLYVAEPSRRREEYALTLLALVYQEALLRRIRGDLGETYAPTAKTAMPDHGDQGYLIAEVETSAANLSQVRAELTAIGAKVARGDFTDDDLETVRKPLLQRLTNLTESNDAWADALQGASTDSTALNDLEHRSAVIASISSADVRKVAAAWLSSAPIAVVVTAKPLAQSAGQKGATQP